MYQKFILSLLLTLCFTAGNLKAQYCTPSTTTCGGSEVITNFTLNTINNTSSGCGVTSQGYSNYTSQSTTLNQGQTYTVSVTVTPSYGSDTVFIWIDYNQNSAFDASEKVAMLYCYTTGSSQTCSGTFTVPTGIATGNTRLRARLTYTNTGNNNPCGVASFGETEDYTVNIVNPSGSVTALIQPTNGNDVGVGYRDVTCSNPPHLSDSNNYNALAYENNIMAWTFNGCFGIYRILVRFDDIKNTSIIPAGAIITSAKLCFFGLDTSTGNIGNSNYPGAPPLYNNSNNLGYVYELNDTFNLYTVTWNNQPAYKHNDSTLIPQTTTRWHQKDTMDVTNMVRDMYSNINTGFLLKINTEQYYRQQDFGSSRNPDASKHPALIVTYELPCSGQPTAANITTSSPASICTGGTQTIAATDPNGTAGMYYQWQQASAPAGPWSNVVGGSGGTSLSYNTPALSSNTYYRIIDSCSNSHLTNTSAVFTVNIINAPAISTQPSGSTICAGASTSFSVAANNGTLSYQWRVNTGTGFTTISNVGVYSGATTNTLSITGALAAMNGYIYQCVVSNGCGVPVNSNSATLNVNALPAVTTQPSNTVTCPGNNASFSVVATGPGLTYQWRENGLPLSNGGVYGGVTTPTLTLTGATLAMNGRLYSCVVSGTCLPNATSSAAILNVSVFAATVTAVGSTSFCSGSSVTLNANIIPSANYQWQMNGSNISGATGTSYAASVTGGYSVTISTPNGCSATATSVYVNVVPAPPVPVITWQGPLTVCAGTNVTLHINGVFGNNYQWRLNGADIPGANGISYSVPVSGDYSVFASNSSNCVDSSTPVTVTVNPNPAPFIIIPEGPDTICLGSKVTLSSDAPSSGLTYQWYDNSNQIIGALSPTYDAPDSGNYTLVITDGNGCFTKSIPFHVIMDVVSPEIQHYGNMLCTGIYPSYQWYFNGQIIPGATGTCYTPAANGKYSLWASDAIGCGGMSNYIDVEDLTGVNNVGTSTEFRIYPNPATSVIHIDAPVKINVSISGIEGKEILNYNNAKDIDISQLPSGIYMIRVYDENQSLLHTEKLVKTSW